jgi:hypothetical protein
MRARKHWVLGVVILTALVGYLGLAPVRCQDRPALLPSAGADDNETLDVSKLDPLHRGIFLSARRGAEWLWQANRPNGLFLYGYIPSLDTPMEGDSYLRQIGGAFALARAARFLGDPRFAARARQAALTLLATTEVDPKDPTVRYAKFPSAYANRLGAAGLLLLAIHELPEPGEDLLQQSDQLCQFIRSQQQADGSLRFQDDLPPDNPLNPQNDEDKEGINYYPGEALYGLMKSQQHRPADWKIEVARKALAYYRPWWHKHRNTALVPWHSSAYAEAYLLTKEKVFADFVFEMNDWMASLQYGTTSRHNPLWQGGFAVWMNGTAVAMPPRVGSASYAEGLAAACRVARQAGDVARYQRYREATERCLQFLMTLQYTPANTRQFTDWYRPRLYGAFFGSHQDGSIRVDYTQHAICAMIEYLQYVADVPPARSEAAGVAAGKGTEANR